MKTTTFKSEVVYDMIVKWWEGHKFPILPLNFLPKTCLILHTENHKYLYATFIYQTDSDLCWIAFPVSNPDVSKEEKQGGLQQLIKDTTEYVQSLGYKYLFTTSPLPVIQDALIEQGFTLGDEGVNHYMKLI